MRKNANLFLFVFMCLLNFGLMGQETYSKTYHLEVGNDNRAQQFFLEDNGFVVGTTHSGDTSVVSAFTRFDFDGNIMDQNSYADFVLGENRSVVRTADGFEIAGYTWSLDSNDARGLELVKLNNDLDFSDRILINYEIERNTNQPGILDIDSLTKVVYGSFITTGSGNGSGAYVALLDQETDSILSEVIFKGLGADAYGNFRVFDVQETLDGNMLFIVEVTLPGAGPSGGSHFEIIKFNWDGEVLKKIESMDDGDNQAIVQDDDGDIYFYNNRTPFYIDTVDFFGSTTGGGIVKLSADMDSVLWSFSIEDHDEIIDGRGHRIFGIKQLSDGNLLASGIVRYSTVQYNTLIELEDNGFLCKFTKEGEVLWVREYGIPIPENYIDLSEFRKLGTSRIEDCKELDDGRILCIGENAYAKPETSFFRELWILMLDENGCLEPDCEASQILTNTSSALPTQSGHIYPNPVTDILQVVDVSFDTFVISDMMGRKVLEGSFTSEIDLPMSMSSGMYVLQLIEGQRLKSVFTFLKETGE